MNYIKIMVPYVNLFKIHHQPSNIMVSPFFKFRFISWLTGFYHLVVFQEVLRGATVPACLHAWVTFTCRPEWQCGWVKACWLTLLSELCRQCSYLLLLNVTADKPQAGWYCFLLCDWLAFSAWMPMIFSLALILSYFPKMCFSRT